MKLELKSIVIFALFLLPYFVEVTLSKRQSRKAEGKLAEWQKRYLEKIQLLAREGGLPEAEWKGITKFDKDVCYERDCLQSALEFMTATNFTVDPCNHDLWLNFVCTRRVNGPDNINQLERLMKVTDLQTQRILQGKVGGLKGDFLLKEAQTYYYQCTKKALNDKQDVKTILNYLSENYGNWPILTNRKPGEQFNWANMVADLNRIGRFGLKPLLFQVAVPSQQGAGSHIELGIGQMSFSYSGADYDSFLRRVQKNAELKKPFRSEMLQPMLNNLNYISGAALQLNPIEKVTIAQLQKRTNAFFKSRNQQPNINWLEFFQRALNGSNIEISADTVVASRLKNVINILERINDSEPEYLSNALNFQFATVLLQESTSLLDNLNTFKCTEQPGSRESICLERAKELFGYSLGKSYLKAHYDDAKSTPAIEELMSKIQRGYIDVIEENEWMENSTKEFLKDKVQSIRTYISQPDWTRKRNGLQRFYRNLIASNDKNSSYPLNYLSVSNWSVGKVRSHSHKIAQMTSFADAEDFHIYDNEWSRYLGTVQAQFHKGINEARIEGGIVQSPIFQYNAPGFMNYGGLGMILSHEVGHSFDQIGRKFDKNGNFGEFWDTNSIQKYNEWVLKIADDYGKEAHQTSETSAETIDGTQTLNEDISDILGVHISYLAYEEHLKDLEAEGQHEKILPGLKTYSPEKLFFMKYANMWCDNKDIQDKYTDMQSSHSTGNVRATLPLRHSKQFAETFDCEIPK